MRYTSAVRALPLGLGRGRGLVHGWGMRVTEIFFSVQGEGTRAGLPCAFVRFTGCDLRCVYCDTAYAFHGGQERSQEEILAALAEYPCRRVLLTGGEPLLQKDLPALARALLARGWEVLVETHGQRPLDALPPEVVRVVDVKTPGSGEPATDLAYLDRLEPHDEVKFVVTSREDFDWSLRIVRERALTGRAHVLFSPVWGKVEPRALAAWLLESGVDARLSLQIHKVIWGVEARGV
jgi:7-carboxy-7-deazaguanine synthase